VICYACQHKAAKLFMSYGNMDRHKFLNSNPALKCNILRFPNATQKCYMKPHQPVRSLSFLQS
jgi:hypothetical protein